MTAMSTRAPLARPYLAPPTLADRVLLAGAHAMESIAHRRMSRRQQLAERVAAGYDPAGRRQTLDVDAYRASKLR